MATSGVAVNPACLSTYNELKLKKQHRYIIYQLNQGMTEIVVGKTSTDKDYEAFLADLPPDEPRFAVYDFEFQKEGGGQRNKLVFYSWNPDGAKIKAKMVYSSSRDSLRRALIGIAAEIQGTDEDEVSYDTVLEKAGRGA